VVDSNGNERGTSNSRPDDGGGADDESAELEELRHRIDALRVDLVQVDKRLRAAMRERPFLALGAALAAGFLLGRAIGRS